MVTCDEFTSEISPVDEYLIEDSNGSFVSFSAMPVLFDDTCILDASHEKFFLRGVANGGLQPICKEIVGWKLMPEYYRAKIMVLTIEGIWITLVKPKEGYLLEERSMIITVEFLHFLMKEPNSSEDSLWDHLRKIFGELVFAPSEKDIKDYSLINLFIERNETLAASPILLNLLGGKSRNSSTEGQSRDSFIDSEVVAVEGNITSVGDDSRSGNLHDSDSFCAICDDGGDIVCCEGGCFRSFHATKAAGESSMCKSLGLTEEYVKATPKFICKNCMYEKHQCFVCGKLGSSSKVKGAEVYACDSHACGHFYHPKCIANHVFWDSKAEAIDYEKKIKNGKPFNCPLHHCAACKKVENKKVKGSQLAICRRCPKAYHKKCLPRKIIVEDKSIKRVWDDPKFDRIVMYCLKHSINLDTATPSRDHIIFPDEFEKKRVPSERNKNIKTKKKKRKHTFSDDLKESKRSCKKILDSPDSQMAAAIQNNKSMVNEERHHVADDLDENGISAKQFKKSEEHSTSATENGQSEEKATDISIKQKGKASGGRSHRTCAKTGKRVVTTFKKFNKSRSSMMHSQIGKLMVKTNMHKKAVQNMHKKAVQKSSTSLKARNRNSMMQSTNVKQSDETIEQAKVMGAASKTIDIESEDATTGSRQENAMKIADFKVLNFEKGDQMNVVERQEFGSSGYGNDSTVLPSLFRNLGRFLKPWSSAKASSDRKELRNGMQQCLRGFSLGPNKSARSRSTSCGWLDD